MARQAFEPESVRESAHPENSVEWWYFNTVLRSPGTPVDGWGVLSSFNQLPKERNEHFIEMVLPPSREVINNTRFGLSPGQMKASASSLDLSVDGSWLRGGYPDYEWCVAGKLDGQDYELLLRNRADMAPLKKRFQFPGVASYFDQFAIFRSRQEGTLRIGDEKYSVTGQGYHEHCYGDFVPEEAKGWYWYFVPGGVSDVDINVFMLIDKSHELNPRNVDFTIDGKTFHMFEDCRFEAISWTDVAGHRGYANEFRVSKRTGDAELDITLRRDPLSAGFDVAGAALFVTGFVDSTGFLEWKGSRYEVQSRSIGSAAVLC